MTFIADVFPDILATKNMLRKISKKTVFQRILRQRTRQMGRNSVAILIAVPLHNLLITVKIVALGKVSFSDTQNPKAVCYQIDSQ